MSSSPLPSLRTQLHTLSTDIEKAEQWLSLYWKEWKPRSILLSLHVSMNGLVEAQTYQYYKVKVEKEERTKALKISLDAIAGDPDLFVGIAEFPTMEECGWKSAGEGDDFVVIQPPLGEMIYYISVFGYSASKFKIMYSFVDFVSIKPTGKPTHKLAGVSHAELMQQVAKKIDDAKSNVLWKKELATRLHAKAKHSVERPMTLPCISISGIKKIRLIEKLTDILCLAPDLLEAKDFPPEKNYFLSNAKLRSNDSRILCNQRFCNAITIILKNEWTLRLRKLLQNKRSILKQLQKSIITIPKIVKHDIFSTLPALPTWKLFSEAKTVENQIESLFTRSFFRAIYVCNNLIHATSAPFNDNEHILCMLLRLFYCYPTLRGLFISKDPIRLDTEKRRNRFLQIVFEHCRLLIISPSLFCNLFVKFDAFMYNQARNDYLQVKTRVDLNFDPSGVAHTSCKFEVVYAMPKSPQLLCDCMWHDQMIQILPIESATTLCKEIILDLVHQTSFVLSHANSLKSIKKLTISFDNETKNARELEILQNSRLIRLSKWFFIVSLVSRMQCWLICLQQSRKSGNDSPALSKSQNKNNLRKELFSTRASLASNVNWKLRQTGAEITSLGASWKPNGAFHIIKQNKTAFQNMQLDDWNSTENADRIHSWSHQFKLKPTVPMEPMLFSQKMRKLARECAPTSCRTSLPTTPLRPSPMQTAFQPISPFHALHDKLRILANSDQSTTLHILHDVEQNLHSLFPSFRRASSVSIPFERTISMTNMQQEREGLYFHTRMVQTHSGRKKVIGNVAARKEKKEKGNEWMCT